MSIKILCFTLHEFHFTLLFIKNKNSVMWGLPVMILKKKSIKKFKNVHWGNFVLIQNSFLKTVYSYRWWSTSCQIWGCFGSLGSSIGIKKRRIDRWWETSFAIFPTFLVIHSKNIGNCRESFINILNYLPYYFSFFIFRRKILQTM